MTLNPLETRQSQRRNHERLLVQIQFQATDSMMRGGIGLICST
jgi:hypothetical protein